MSIREELQATIQAENETRRAFHPASLWPLVKAGQAEQAFENLIFFADPGKFEQALPQLLSEIRNRFSTLPISLQERCLQLLTNLALSLGSFLPAWNLTNAVLHGEKALTADKIAFWLEQIKDQCAMMEKAAPSAAVHLLALWRKQAQWRYKAEQSADPAAEAQALTGGTIQDYIKGLSNELKRSHLRRIAEMRQAGLTRTEISNDYAAFLPYALYLGVSFQTTNPPLVNLAWAAEPDVWDPLVKKLINDNPAAGAEELARLFTMEVVLAQMKLLRPIFLLTAGQMGCVCLQVNPVNHAHADEMIADALFFYNRLRERLAGGIPNVVFKLPGTQAGLVACRDLTRRGIGVTITVDFGMFQHLPFLQALQEGHAIFSCLVEMNGRLAYPVRDELLSRLPELAAYGINETKARWAAAWAGVAVAKRLQRLMKANGVDLNRIKLLIASLRVYQGEAYNQLPSAFPDITELIGASLISVFPNIRRAFDKQENIAINPQQVDEPAPAEALGILAHSEIFKQAYYVDNPRFREAEDELFLPAKLVSLAEEEATAAWKPVQSTLNEFIHSYEETIQRIAEMQRAP